MDSSFGVFFTILIIIVLGVYIYTQLTKLKNNNKESKPSPQKHIFEPRRERLPYHVKGNFFTSNERSFLFALGNYVEEKVYICPKVGLKEIFFINKNVGSDYQKFFNKINRKHVDFVLVNLQKK